MLSLPTIRDRIVLVLLKDNLHEYFTDCVNRELPNSYIRKVKKFLEKNKTENIYFLKTDIQKFYDEIDREILSTELGKRISDMDFLKLVTNAIETPTVPSNYKKTDLDKYFLNKGVPQGLPISNILAQIFLKNFDDYFTKQLSSSLYLRYVDDIIILGKSDCSSLLKSIQKKLIKIGVCINEDKTLLGNLEMGIDFLGYSINKDKISIVNKTIEGQINKIAAKVTWYKKGLLNPKARPNWLINNDNAFKKRHF